LRNIECGYNTGGGAKEVFSGKNGTDSRTVPRSNLSKGVLQSLPGRKFLRWAPSSFGVTVSFTYELGVYLG